MKVTRLKCNDCEHVDSVERFEAMGSRRGARHRCPECNSPSNRTVERHRVPLLNFQTLGASCGHGEGATQAEAVADALKIARETDPAARFDGAQVCYAGGINC